METSSYETLEALASEIARVCGTNGSVGRVKVSVEKPSALAFVDGAGVQITRKFCEDTTVPLSLGDKEELSDHKYL